mgnify:CR=1 FL=1
MKKLFKKFAAIGMAAMMIMAMGVTVFAAEGETTILATNLYRDGEYDAANPDGNLSMGDGAVKDTTYVDNGDGTYTVTFNFEESFPAMGFTGYLRDVAVDLDNDGDFDADDAAGYQLIYGAENASAVIGLQFISDSIPSYNTLYNVEFTINVWIMPIGAEGDLVVLPGMTE